MADPRRGERIRLEIADEVSNITPRYQIDQYIGGGSYGEVCGALDTVTGRRVAIKRVHQCLQHGRKKDILGDLFLSKRVLREVLLLSHFKHENILGLHAILRPPGPQLTKMYLVTDCMVSDLQAIIRSGQHLTESHVQYFGYQILVGLKALHDARVMHRDLHPANILLNLDNDIKICDFNLGREEAHAEPTAPGGTPGPELTDYVTSRWYRAPELVMQWTHYTRAVDVWSAGCVLAELYRGTPLFRGANFYQQLDEIVRVVGRPPFEQVAHIGSPAARLYLKNNPEFASLDGPRPLSVHLPRARPEAVDLISKMLQFVPERRITVDEALAHEYFADLHSAEDQAVAHPPPPEFTRDAFIESLSSAAAIRDALDAHITAFMAQQAEFERAEAARRPTPTGSPV